MQNSWIDWLQPIIPRAALLSIYKSFFRPHLNYGDVIYDLMNESFLNKLESVQYNEALVIIGAIRGSSGEKLYQKLGLESLKSWQWHRKLLLFSKLKKMNIPLTSLIYFPKSYQQWLPDTIKSFHLMLNIILLKLFFSHPLLLMLIIFKFWNWLVLLKNKSSNFSNQILIVCLCAQFSWNQTAYKIMGKAKSFAWIQI